MPFPSQNAKPFTADDIIANTQAGQEGVYGLVRQHGQSWIWIYVGKSEDIRRRLLEHVAGLNTCIVREGPSHWVAGVGYSNVDVAEVTLIREYRPVCNEQYL